MHTDLCCPEISEREHHRREKKKNEWSGEHSRMSCPWDPWRVRTYFGLKKNAYREEGKAGERKKANNQTAKRLLSSSVLSVVLSA